MTNQTNLQSAARLDTQAEHVVRPLLQLMQRLTGVESTFLTLIDLDTQQQDVVLAFNSAALDVAEGTRLTWQDSMCRLAFLSGKPCSLDGAADFPGSLGAEMLGLQSFFAVPVTSQGRLVGSLCGASQHRTPVGPDVLQMIELIAQAVTPQLSLVACVSDAQARLAQDVRILAELRESAATDVLTGLLNRDAFLARYKQELARAVRHGEDLAVLCLDVDRFKSVNDTHGREVGDQVLKALAFTLRTVAREEDVAACLGGDKFVLVLARSRNVEATGIADRVRSVFTQACAALGVSVSLGIGVACSRTTARAELLHVAEQMLFQCKRAGREPALPAR
jgi:diguanylate cyclase